MTASYNVEINFMPHDLIKIQTTAGNTIEVSNCMLDRLKQSEIKSGKVPDSMPEYDDPPGSKCHPEWRGGCGAEEELDD